VGFVLIAAAIAAQALVPLLLVRALGLPFGLVISGLLIVTQVAIGGLLLRGSTVGSVTWRNRIAGLLLPWSAIVGGGSLGRLIAANGAASLLFAVGIIAADRAALLDAMIGPDQDAATSAVIVRWILFGLTGLGWIAMSLLWLWLLRSVLKNRSDIVSVLVARRDIRLPLLIPPIAIPSSIALRALGWPIAALAVVAIPLLLLLLPLLLMFSAILIGWLRGKPLRWN